MSAATLSALRSRYPEWAPWLGLVGRAADALEDPAWAAQMSAAPEGRSLSAPLLAGAQLGVDPARVAALFDALMSAAARSGAATLATLGAVSRSAQCARTALAAAVNGDEATLDALASQAGADGPAFRAVCALLAMPLLHACRERWGGAEGWDQGYCPLCASWPAFAEVRGVERSRHLRCGACGSAWAWMSLRCARCRNTDHETLASLVVEGGPQPFLLEVCSRCGSYLKVATTLQGCAPAAVMVEDLATADLDLAAAARGHTRPAGRGHALGVRLTAAGRQ